MAINMQDLLKLHESFETEHEYRVDKAVSYSILKDINSNPNVLIVPKVQISKSYLDFGTLVDTLLTTPNILKEKVFVTKHPLPSDTIQSVVKLIVDKLQKDISEVTTEDAVDLFNKIDSNVRWLPATKLKKILTEGSHFYKIVKQAKGRIIITDSLLQKAKLLAIQVKTHPWITQYFSKSKSIMQYKMKVQYDNVDVKAMLDILFINTKHKTITPIDIKTGSLHPKAFLVNFYKYKYYYQGCLYRKVLTDFIHTNIKELAEYKIMPFKFIFISTINYLYPTIWNITDKKHQDILKGYKDIYSNKIKGINELIKDVSIYKKQFVQFPYTTLAPIDLQITKGEINIEI